MANTYYDSQLTAEEIEEVLEAINGILNPANNGKVLAISNGKLEARSVQWGGGSAVLEPLSVTQNGTYNPPSGVDGYAPVTVNVSGVGEAFVESQGSAYFNTGVAGNTVYGIVIDFMPIEVVGNYQSYAQGTYNNFTIGSMTPSAGVTVGFVRCNNTDFGLIAFVKRSKNTVSCKDGTIKVNGTTINTFSGPIDTTSATIKILGDHSIPHARILKCELYDSDGLLIHNYVPYLDENLIACLHDTVTDTYVYGNNHNLTFGYM